MDPLALNYHRQTRELIDSIPSDAPHHILPLLSSIEETVRLRPVPVKTLLQQLSRALEVPALTWLVARSFRPIILDLASRWLDDPVFKMERIVAIAFLLEAFEELYPIVVRLLDHSSALGGPLAQHLAASSQSLEDTPAEVLHAILLSYYRLVWVDQCLPGEYGWSADHLKKLFESHPDRGVRFLAVRCFAMQVNLTEVERDTLDEAYVGAPGRDSTTIYLMTVISGDFRRVPSGSVEGWTLPVFEVDRVFAIRRTFHETPGFYEWSEYDLGAGSMLDSSYLSSSVVSASGILLLKHAAYHEPPAIGRVPPFVITPTLQDACQTVALHLSQRIPCLITSAPSSGKTALLHHIARLSRGSASHVVSIHLADVSLDAKSLLGSYVSSSTTPGTFDWVDGALVRAMKLGSWLVLEDIDRASQDVLSTLLPVIESMGPTKTIGGRAFVDVPARSRLHASLDFMIFATRSLAPSESSTDEVRGTTFPPSVFFGHQHLSEVILPVLDKEEVPVLLHGLFPRLAPAVIDLLVSIWLAARGMANQSQRSARSVGLLDLLKLCGRVYSMFGFEKIEAQPNGNSLRLRPSSQEEVFLEALDVFGSSSSKEESVVSPLIDSIRDRLGVSEERASWILSQRVPELRVDSETYSESLLLGRVSLRPNPAAETTVSASSRPFVLHRPSLLLLEQLAAGVHGNEPVLLVGETGTGKTSAVQHLASLLKRPLTVLNLSLQSETVDILGGFKPVDPRVSATPLQERFVRLFMKTFSRKRNAAFADAVRSAFLQGKWARLSALWRESARLARDRLGKEVGDMNSVAAKQDGIGSPAKRRKLIVSTRERLSQDDDSWAEFEAAIQAFEAQHLDTRNRFVFQFVDGPLIRALRNGEWILLDEVNLASVEVLESLLGVLEGPDGSVTLIEKGDLTPVPRHADFRLFACMNPATDVGKKDLPFRLRRRFTEIFVTPAESDQSALVAVIQQYLGNCSLGDRKAILDFAEFYVSVRRMAEDGRLSDAANEAPHYNMRTLARALTYAAKIASIFGLRRALWEAVEMCFTMSLDNPSLALARKEAERSVLSTVKNTRSLLLQMPPPPGPQFVVEFAPYYVERGPLAISESDHEYVMTPSVRTKVWSLARVVAAGHLPVLLQGPTSSGKTSSIEYLARRTGHRFIRINNHEHTDIQEYVGSYTSDPDSGRLVYKEGLLVRALRQGDWVVLDELNLAPTDVLEALNRLLDDNHELLIPETQELVHPHPHFRLFATQNPPGLYGGRKPLSRAFRNRFVEIHFGDVPESELEVILCERCGIAPSYAQRMVAVFRELQRRRQGGRIFENKHGFATLRDLFRWANRRAESVLKLAEDGYMLLAERARNLDDREVVREVLQEVMKVPLDPSSMYALDASSIPGSGGSLVWTSAMSRLYRLVVAALRHDEPVLLVGETGTGKSTICQVLAEAAQRPLFSISCHLNTETADLLGGLRPVRERTSPNDSLIEWQDGPLVDAMRVGGFLLLDEISLADDSVLERLNSVLEPARSLVLAEKGGTDLSQLELIAAPGFQLLATMNPGGDYGKKELSPALRNRFTEIFVPPVDSISDRRLIIMSSWSHVELSSFTDPVLAFWEWTAEHVQGTFTMGLRDVLSWVTFMNRMVDQHGDRLTGAALFHHAARLVYVDAVGNSFSSAPSDYHRSTLIERCLQELRRLVPLSVTDEGFFHPVMHQTVEFVSFGPFSVLKGKAHCPQEDFTFHAPTTRENAMRVFRASQLIKPILLEGGPGVGKTSLITAIAACTGHRLCRINLSDQTDLTDLFGSDLPVEGGGPGEFAWRSAAFLRAMETGDWVLLDEMNLAPQPVLEGLNAILDHRGKVYIPELHRTFERHPNFRVFAAQNPSQQGGGRKGLPKSFVNRFTRVFVSELQTSDYVVVCRHLYPAVPQEHLEDVVRFSQRLAYEADVVHSFSGDGVPWEFNLRDVLRWLQLYRRNQCRSLSQMSLQAFDLIYSSRFRGSKDKVLASRLYGEIFSSNHEQAKIRHWFSLTPEYVQFGHTLLERSGLTYPTQRAHALLRSQLSASNSAAACLQENWLVILTGPSGAGKSSLARFLARICGKHMLEFSMSPSTDPSDLLGGFEQIDPTSQLLRIGSQLARGLSRHRHVDVLALTRTKMLQDTLLSSLRSLEHASSMEDYGSIIRTYMEALDWLEAGDSTSHEWPKLRRMCSSLEINRHRTGQFQWVDGVFVQAMREGSWLLLDNANICSSAVLDRLNSVFEENGTLLLNERGLVNGIVPEIRRHPSFRVVMVVNPQYGELSRAMRNRGVEISLQCDHWTGVDAERLKHVMRLPSQIPVPSNHLMQGLLLGKKARLAVFDLPLAPGPDGVLWAASFSSLLLWDSRLANQSGPVAVSWGANTDNEDGRLTYLTQVSAPICFGSVQQLHDDRLSMASPHAPRLKMLEVPPILLNLILRARRSLSEALYVPVCFLQAQPSCLCLNPLYDTQSPSLVLKDALCSEVVEILTTLDLLQARSLPYLMTSKDEGRESHAKVATVQELIKQYTTSLVSSVAEVSRRAIHDYLSSSDLPSSELLDGIRALVDFTTLLLPLSFQHHVDFSALRLIASWYVDNRCMTYDPFEDVSRIAHAFLSATTPQRGASMSIIWWQTWKDYQHTGLLAGSTVLTESRLVENSGLQRPPSSIDVEVQHLGMSISSSGVVHDGFHSPGHQESLQLTNDDSNKDGVCHRTLKQAGLSDDGYSVGIGCLPFLGPTSKRTVEALSEAVGGLLDECPGSLADLTGFVKGVCRTEDCLPPWSTPHAFVRWFKLVQDAPSQPKGDLDVGRIFTAQELCATLRLQAESPALGSLQQYRARIQRRYSYVIKMTQIEQRSRYHELRCSLLRFLQSLCLPFKSSFPVEVYSRIQSFDINSQDTEKGLSWLVDVSQTTSEAFASCIRAMSNMLQPLFRPVTSYSSGLLTLGRAHVAVTHAVLELYWPEIPMDPLSAHSCELSLLSRREDLVLALLAHHQAHETQFTGGTSNHLITSLLHKLQLIRTDIGSLGLPPLARPASTELLHSLFAEVNQFCEKVLKEDRVSALVQCLEVGYDDTSRLSVLNLQESTRAFSERLELRYAGLYDISFMAIVALCHLQLGLALVTRSAQLGRPLSFKEAMVKDFRQKIIEFPTVAVSADLEHAPFNVDDCTTRQLLIRLALIVRGTKVRRTPSNSSGALDVLYNALHARWDKSRADDKAKEEAEQSLYRANTAPRTNVEFEEEAEELEFKSLFPDYADLESSSSNPAAASDPFKVTSEDASRICQLHYLLLEESSPSVANIDTLLSTLRAQEMSQTDTDIYTEETDLSSLVYRVSSLSDCLQRLDGFVDSTAPQDFYWGENTAQLHKASEVLKRLVTKCTNLLQHWPDQVQLLHIRERCESVLQHSIRSPLARVLVGLEALLQDLETWDGFANKDTSLKKESDVLVSLIIDWRRTELRCWSQTLKAELLSHSEQTSDWFFPLFSACSQVAHQQGVDGKISQERLSEFLDLLDDFISKSPLGQFEGRLRLLLSFSIFMHCGAVTAEDPASSPSSQVGRVIHSLVLYYQQFRDSVSSYARSRLGPIEEDVKSFVKLASWKDVNVAALKQSAHKTHRKLFQAIRKCRSILRQPVQSLLTFGANGTSTEISESSPSLSFILRSESSARHDPSASRLTAGHSMTIELSSALRQFLAMSTTQLRPLIMTDSFSRLEFVATSFIDSLQSFADETLRADTDARKRALTAVKRKAWSDALKELRSFGLPSRLPSNVIKSQTERSSLLSYGSPLLAFDGYTILRDLVSKSDSYFVRLCGLVPLMRRSVERGHEDVSRRDLLAAGGLVEAIFSMSLQSRKLLAEAYHSMHKWQCLIARFDTIVTGDPQDMLYCGNLVQQYLDAVFVIEADLVSVLEEVLDKLPLFEDLPGTSMSSVVAPDLRSMLDTHRVVRDNLRRMCQAHAEIGLTFLRAGELAEVVRASEQLRQSLEAVKLLSRRAPHLSSLLGSTASWLDGAMKGIPDLNLADDEVSDENADAAMVLCDQAISSVLLIAQQLRDVPPTENGGRDLVGDTLNIPGTLRRVQRVLQILRARSTFQVIIDFIHGSHLNSKFSSTLVHRMDPFLREYTDLVTAATVNLAQWNKAALKLTFVMCSAVSRIAEAGFCKPPQTEDEDETKGSNEVLEGTGVGEGHGLNAEQDDLRDNSQVEGLQDEDNQTPPDDGPQNSEDPGQSLELDMEFGGRLEDVEENPSDGEESLAESEVSVGAEETGDLDPLDPASLDEKLWGDTSDPKDSTEQPRDNMDLSSHDSMRRKLAAEHFSPADDGRNSLADDDMSQSDEEELAETGSEVGMADNVPPASEELELPQSEALDLPEGLDLGDGQEEQVSAHDSVSDTEEQLSMRDDMDVDTDGGSTHGEGMEEPDPIVSGADEPNRNNDASLASGDPIIQQASQSFQSGIGRDEGDFDADSQEQGKQEEAISGENDEIFNDSIASTSEERGSRGRYESEGEPLPRPDAPGDSGLLGDPSLETVRNDEDILSAPTSHNKTEGRSHLNQGRRPLLEHVTSEEQEPTLQALGPKPEGELDKPSVIEQQSTFGESERPLPKANELQHVVQEPESHPALHDFPPNEEHGLAAATTSKEQDVVSHDEIQEAAGAFVYDSGPSSDGSHTVSRRFDFRGLWHRYVSLTLPLASALSEQLRLILEPTQATRLQGDYRTGKRLNMKKIIQYIASDFTKDKIWLRRTKPSRREYQVLIALDDSQSMAQSDSIHLAFQTLTLVCGALGKLEVGDVAILRFGETVDMVHPFGAGPLTDEAGEDLASHFTFTQTRTNMQSLLESSIATLSSVRDFHRQTSSTADDLWQLEIIISDGICQHHDRLRSLLRKATEEKIVVVFIILDSLRYGGAEGDVTEHGSILSMMQGAYRQTNGKMELHMDRYMDTFPFEYYIVLRDVHALPDVLSSTLKQFFEIK